MDTWVYQIGGTLYLNLTNKCSSRCIFCIRSKTPCLAGYKLVIKQEPSAQQVLDQIEDPCFYNEIVFCGYGEPTYRLETMLGISSQLKQQGAITRLDTNGQGDLINGKEILPLLKGKIDKISVSLNAACNEDYQRICRPSFGEEAFPAVCKFIREAVALGFDVTATAVAIPELDLEPIAELAQRLGAKWRVRMYN